MALRAVARETFFDSHQAALCDGAMGHLRGHADEIRKRLGIALTEEQELTLISIYVSGANFAAAVLGVEELERHGLVETVTLPSGELAWIPTAELKEMFAPSSAPRLVR